MGAAWGMDNVTSSVCLSTEADVNIRLLATTLLMALLGA